MDKHLAEMKRILKEEKGLFEKVYSLEKDKTGVIISRDGKLLEKLSKDQEDILATISGLETERIRHVDNYRKHHHIRKDPLTISDLAASVGNAPGADMILLGRELKDVMKKLARVQETNRVLINDNMEYYNILITGLRRDSSIDGGYGSDGREEEILKNSILFNQTA
jgi:hypothetical protein